MAVLLEEEGTKPTRQGEKICTTYILDDEVLYRNNYDSINPHVRYEDGFNPERELDDKNARAKLIRTWKNLLSSKQVSLNFWAPLKENLELANQLLPHLIPGFGRLDDIDFDWASDNDHPGLKSGYDVLIKYRDIEGLDVWLGLESEYTGTMSREKYDCDEYRALYDRYRNLFKADYKEFIRPKYIKLFRNHLLACSMNQFENRTVWCGMFIPSGNGQLMDLALDYRRMLVDAEVQFQTINYGAFISSLQMIDLSWNDREWSMMLWARYMGMSLSNWTYSNIDWPVRVGSDWPGWSNNRRKIDEGSHF